MRLPNRAYRLRLGNAAYGRNVRRPTGWPYEKLIAGASIPESRLRRQDGNRASRFFSLSHHPCDANASTTTNRFGSVPPGPVTLDAPFSTTTTTIPAKLGQCEYTTPPYMHAREHEELRTHSNRNRISNRKRIQDCRTIPKHSLQKNIFGMISESQWV